MKIGKFKIVNKNSQCDLVAAPKEEMVITVRNESRRCNIVSRTRLRTAFRQMRQCCTGYSILVFILSCTIIFTALMGITYFLLNKSVHVVVIDGYRPLTNVVGEKFLSVAIDSSLIAEGFKHLDLTKKKFRLLLSAMAPAYLRIGGTMADRLIFIRNNSLTFKTTRLKNIADNICAYESTNSCKLRVRPNFTMSGYEWLELYNATRSAGLSLIFDLNALIRYPNGSWDFSNAQELLDFSALHDMDVHWELGNEPNAFRRVFNYEVKASQLANDFKVLRQLLDNYPRYKTAGIYGPDVTRPQLKKNGSMRYLKEFLVSGGSDAVNAVTWHQYYVSGRTATPANFLDVNILATLEDEIALVKKLMALIGLQDKLIWLGETGSAYAGGCEGLSDRFIGTFMWLDKLGVAAKNGINTVIRQSFVKGNYAMVDNYEPNPDFWVSVIYKMLVGPGVIDCNVASSPWVRIYCHCASKSQSAKSPAITIFAVNVQDNPAYIRFQGTDSKNVYIEYMEIDAYIMIGKETLFSRGVLLNDEELEMTTHGLPQISSQVFEGTETMVMPPFSIGFWVVRGASVNGCPNVK